MAAAPAAAQVPQSPASRDDFLWVLGALCALERIPFDRALFLGQFPPPYTKEKLLAALPRAAKQGVKLPETVNGKLAVRVAMGYDGLAALHQQIGRVLQGLRAAANRVQGLQ